MTFEERVKKWCQDRVGQSTCRFVEQLRLRGFKNIDVYSVLELLDRAPPRDQRPADESFVKHLGPIVPGGKATVIKVDELDLDEYAEDANWVKSSSECLDEGKVVVLVPPEKA